MEKKRPKMDFYITDIDITPTLRIHGAKKK